MKGNIHNRLKFNGDFMIFSENEMDNIKREMSKLKEEVVLKLFTDYKTQEDGTKLRKCMACEGAYELLKILEDISKGKLKVEEISIEENEEEAKKFNITKINEKSGLVILFSSFVDLSF